MNAIRYFLPEAPSVFGVVDVVAFEAFASGVELPELHPIIDSATNANRKRLRCTLWFYQL